MFSLNTLTSCNDAGIVDVLVFSVADMFVKSCFCHVGAAVTSSHYDTLQCLMSCALMMTFNAAAVTFVLKSTYILQTASLIHVEPCVASVQLCG